MIVLGYVMMLLLAAIYILIAVAFWLAISEERRLGLDPLLVRIVAVLLWPIVLAFVLLFALGRVGWRTLAKRLK